MIVRNVLYRCHSCGCELPNRSKFCADCRRDALEGYLPTPAEIAAECAKIRAENADRLKEGNMSGRYNDCGRRAEEIYEPKRYRLGTMS
jgi:hypothetical protein